MYVADVNQQEWDDYGEGLTFALNTTHNRVRAETSYAINARSGHLGTVDTSLRLRCAKVEGQYRRAREAVNESLHVAIKSRADRHNEKVRPHWIEEDTQVWLY
ncbi:reverse transcriptase [Phytophthora megakarya]|uniref:Reverse transcriptase n=1 Tax=Phytophthora megakarya TaxID=4795 RepID=A0A225V286_9STRA|nr:reverse transcriptase [Phytophthora megakarya]